MFSNLKLGLRLGAGFAVVLALSASLAGVGVYQLAKLTGNSEQLARNDAPRLEAALRLDSSVNSNARRLSELLLSKDKAEIDRLAERFDVNEKKTAEAVDDLGGLKLSDDAKAVFASIKENHGKYAAVARKMTALGKDGKMEEAGALYVQEVSPALTKFSRSVSDFLKYDDALFSNAMDKTRKVYKQGRMVLGGIAGAAILLGILIAWGSARSITRPIRSAADVANKVAEGDLSSNIEVKTRDELGQLMTALKAMNGNLVNIVGDVRTGSAAISSASTEMAAGNADLSRRTEQQAASLEETASAMEQLTSQVKNSAESAKQANELATSASDVAVRGGEVVGQVVVTMSDISEASEKISDIISVIDGIAFQTNILALNAAVEAARAGEQGRGFAVVATEVRTLAQRSAAAAKEIKTLIQDSVGKVESGKKLVDQAGKTMEDIVSAVKNVTGIMAEIATAAQEQNAGIEQVNHAVTQMDQVTQQNAALVEQAAAAAESVRDQAQSLTNAVAVFKLVEETADMEGDTEEAVTDEVAVEPEAAEPVEAPRVERRGPDRATNVARMPARDTKSVKAEAVKTGTDDDWSEF